MAPDSNVRRVMGPFFRQDWTCHHVDAVVAEHALHGVVRSASYGKMMEAGHAALAAQALEITDSMVISGSDTLDVRDASAVAQRIKGSVSSKQFGYEDLLCPLIAEACIGVCPKNPVSFNVDNVRFLPFGAGRKTRAVLFD